MHSIQIFIHFVNTEYWSNCCRKFIFVIAKRNYIFILLDYITFLLYSNAGEYKILFSKYIKKKKIP